MRYVKYIAVVREKVYNIFIKVENMTIDYRRGVNLRNLCSGKNMVVWVC